jgi:deoxyadenosine/deoxycytidine kinase
MAQSQFMVLKKPQFLTIIGNIGSGKSEAAKLLSTSLNLPAIDADSLFQTIDPFAKNYLKDIDRWAFTNELWLTFNRAKLIEEQADPNQLTVVDSGLLMSWMYGRAHRLAGHYTEKEWRFFRQLYNHFAQDFMSKTLVLRLKYTQKTLFERIKKRGRDFELEYYTPEYIGGLEQGLNELARKLKRNKTPLLTIREQEVPDFVDSKNDATLLVKKTKAFLEKNGEK